MSRSARRIAQRLCLTVRFHCVDPRKEPATRLQAMLAIAVLLIVLPAGVGWGAEPGKTFPYVRSTDGPGFVSLFDGKSLKGWKAADMSWWSVEEGAITARITEDKPCRDNQYLFCEAGIMGDFELKLAHRIVSDHKVNCGFQFRSEHFQGDDCKGYQVDNNTDTPWLVRLYDEFGRHTLAWRGQRTVFDETGGRTESEITAASGEPHFDLRQWHEYHLICKGERLTLKVNGKLVAEAIDNDPQQRDLSGLLALQLHSGPAMTVQFKDIRYKPLVPTADTEPHRPAP